MERFATTGPLAPRLVGLVLGIACAMYRADLQVRHDPRCCCHAVNAGISTPTNTPAPSKSACAIANGTSRRKRRYSSVMKSVCGRGDDRDTRPSAQHLESRHQVAVVGHLLGQSPDEGKHEHAIESGRQRQRAIEIRWCERSVQEPTGRVDTNENERQARRNDREAEQDVAAETRTLEADQIDQAGAFSLRQPPQQRETTMSITVPYTGSQGSASCQGVGDDRRAKAPATIACAPIAQAVRANSIIAGPRQVSVPACGRRRSAS